MLIVAALNANLKFLLTFSNNNDNNYNNNDDDDANNNDMDIVNNVCQRVFVLECRNFVAWIHECDRKHPLLSAKNP